MYLKNKTWQSRRDFTGTYACNHCGFEHEAEGYDDANFHHNVIPQMKCQNAANQAAEPSPTQPSQPT